MTGQSVELTEDGLLAGDFDTPDGGNQRQLAGPGFVQLISSDSWTPKITRPSGIALCTVTRRACVQQLRDGGRGRAVDSIGIRYWSSSGWIIGEAEAGRFQVWAPDGGLAYERDFSIAGPVSVNSTGLGVGQYPLIGEFAYFTPDGGVVTLDAGDASWALDVNDHGLAVGRVARNGGKAALFCGDRLFEVPNPGEYQSFNAVNNAGLAVGTQGIPTRNGIVWYRGFYSTLSQLQVDGGPDPDCTPLGAWDVNESHQIGVVLQCGSERYAAIWQLQLVPPE